MAISSQIDTVSISPVKLLIVSSRGAGGPNSLAVSHNHLFTEENGQTKSWKIKCNGSLESLVYVKSKMIPHLAFNCFNWHGWLCFIYEKTEAQGSWSPHLANYKTHGFQELESGG